jgi:hypothetical protein
MPAAAEEAARGFPVEMRWKCIGNVFCVQTGIADECAVMVSNCPIG